MRQLFRFGVAGHSSAPWPGSWHKTHARKYLHLFAPHLALAPRLKLKQIPLSTLEA